MEKVNYRERTRVWNLLKAWLLEGKKVEVNFMHSKFFRVRLGREKSLVLKKDGTWLID